MFQLILTLNLLLYTVAETSELKATSIMECSKKDQSSCDSMLLKCGYKKSDKIIVEGDIDGATYSYWNEKNENFSIHYTGEKITQFIFDKKEKTEALKLLEEFKALGFKLTEDQTNATRIKQEYKWGKIKLEFKQMGKIFDFNLSFR